MESNPISYPASLAPTSPQIIPSVVPEPSTYGQILKSSALIGGSSVINIGIGIIRTKAMAILLGTSGVGLLGLYNSILDLTQTIAGMGINSSGVRQIAESVGSGDTTRIARTTAVLRRTSFVLGFLGALLLVAFAKPVAVLTFGDDQNTWAIRLLSVAVFFGAVSGGQGALIQGMRRIADMAKMRVIGASFGTLICILLVYRFRENGVVPSIVAFSGMAILTSWWFSRKIRIQGPQLTVLELSHEVKGLLKLGFAFMASGVLSTGAAYLVRLIILHKIDFEAAGLYQSAWAIGGLYVGLILQSMGADFYPRLTGIAKDHVACNRLVNEQAQISLLLAGPGVIATLTFAPLVIALLYTAKFEAAVAILRWICLGMALRVIAWPMGYIVLAKGAQTIFFWTEVAATIVHVGLAWVCIQAFGLAGAGMGFFGLYVWHGFLIYFIVRRLTGFRWSGANRTLGVLTFSLISVVFLGIRFLPFWLATTIGIVAATFSGIYSVRHLVKLVPLDRLPSLLRRLLVGFRFAPADLKN